MLPSQPASWIPSQWRACAGNVHAELLDYVPWDRKDLGDSIVEACSNEQQ